jgi:type IV pilus assembly protein PilM
MRQIHTIGVDVSDSSIKVLEVDAQARITAYGSADLLPGVVRNGSIVNKEAFSEALVAVLKHTTPKALYAENTLYRAMLCLPETKLFTYHVAIPSDIQKSEERTFVQESAEEIVPFTLSDLYWDYHVSGRDDAKTATFVGVPKSDLDAYVEAFSYAKVQPSFVGSELFSLGRSLLPDVSPDENQMIVDLGAETTTVGMFGEDAIAHVSIVIPKGGDFLTQVLVDELGLTSVEAEAQKRSVGIADTEKNSRVKEVLTEHLTLIVNTIVETKTFFEKKSGKKVTTIVLAGGTSLMPGIAAFVSSKTGVQVTLGDPSVRIKNAEVFGADTPRVLFATVIGLALLAHSEMPRINLLSLYRFEKGEHSKEMLRIEEIRTWADFHYAVYAYMQHILGMLAVYKPMVRLPTRHTLTLIGSFAFLMVTLGFLFWVVTKYM